MFSWILIRNNASMAIVLLTLKAIADSCVATSLDII